MNGVNGDIPNLLDNIRRNAGAEQLLTFYRELKDHNMELALHFIQDEHLQFPSLFILRSDAQTLYSYLPLRSRIALDLARGILEKNVSAVDDLLHNYRETVYYALRWMMETGFSDDGLAPEYDRVLDIAAILLAREYRDRTVLPMIADMIFKRYKNEGFVYDLLWAFFECHDPYSLFIIASRFFSTQPKEVELAKKLLHFIPGMERNENISPAQDFDRFQKWFQDNCSFLYCTGESFQQTGSPKPYAVSLEAKYLCKPVSVDSGAIVQTLTNGEYHNLNTFRKLDDDTRHMLAEYSFQLHQRDPGQWKIWMHYPISRQIHIAANGPGGIS